VEKIEQLVRVETATINDQSLASDSTVAERPQPVSGDISPADRRDLYPARFDSKRSQRYPHCRGDLKIIAAIEEPAVIVRDTHAPGLAYARHRVHRRGRCAVPGGPNPQGKSGSAMP